MISIGQINALETDLEAARGTTSVKLGIVFRNDALGIGTRTSLNDLMLNGKRLSDPVNLGNNVHINAYDFSAPDQDAIVNKSTWRSCPTSSCSRALAEAITRVMVPLETAWPASAPRPNYVLIDSVKVPELITATTGNDDLRLRVRGTGITPSPASAAVYDAFKVDYQVAYPGSSIISGMGPAYDATYAIAFALVAENSMPMNGGAVKTGLRRLGSGDTEIDIGATRVLSAFQALANGDSINARGTFSSLAWSKDGTVLGGTLEIWCVGAPGGKPAYQSSGLTFDIMTCHAERPIQAV